MTRPFILLCNDDGIYAPGMKALWESLSKADLFDIAIIAPAAERSGTGCAITWTRPLLVKKVPWEGKTQAWSIDGCPADCIKLGLSIVLDRQPDLIVSGINAGSNAGRNVLHSGTIGAVIEGVLRGIPGIALSCEDDQNPNYHIAEKYVTSLVQYILAHPLDEGSFLNVNFPKAALHDIEGFKLTRQGMGRWVEDPSLHTETDHGPTYWLGGKPEERAEDPECDITLLKQGYLTAAPIHVHELSDKKALSERQEHFSTFFAPVG